MMLALGDQAFALGNEVVTVTPPLSPWIRIDPDGTVTLMSTVSDMGQGSRTGQAQVLADELDAPWEKVRVERLWSNSRCSGRLILPPRAAAMDSWCCLAVATW